MAGKKIIIFLGSTRDGRFGGKVANYIKTVLENAGLEPKIFDPLELEFPVIRTPLHFMKDRSAAPAWLIEANQQIEQADGFVIVSSEYNCSLPPALSNMMDHFPPASYRHRPCSIVTYSMGNFGGVRAATLIQPFVSELGMISLPTRVSLPTVHTKFDADGNASDERFQDNVQKMIKELSWYADALRAQKETAGAPN